MNPPIVEPMKIKSQVDARERIGVSLASSDADTRRLAARPALVIVTAGNQLYRTLEGGQPSGLGLSARRAYHLQAFYYAIISVARHLTIPRDRPACHAGV